MNNFFENHFEEINLITNRSKKESRTTFTRLQKASVYKLESYNNSITYENIYNLEGINVHQVSEDGKFLFGSSDRVYLPDVATRLYQGLEDILKSYKSHKVHSADFKTKSLDDTSSNIDHIDLSDWSTEYFHEMFGKVYNEIDEEARSSMNLLLQLEGYHSLWQIFNPEHKSREFDEFLLCITFTIESKETNEVVLSKTHKVKVNDIRSRKVGFEDIVEEINFAAKAYLLAQKSKPSEKFKPDIVLLDSDLTSKLLLKLFNLNPDHKIFKDIRLNEQCDYNCVNETYDKFGNYCDEDNEKQERDSLLVLRQTYFNNSPKYYFRNFNFGECEDFECENDLQKVLEQVSSKFKSKNILLLSGSRDSHFRDDFSEEIVIQPSMKFYFDGKQVSNIDIEFLEINDLDSIKLLSGNRSIISKLPDFNILVGMNGFSYSILPLKNINFI